MASIIVVCNNCWVKVSLCNSKPAPRLITFLIFCSWFNRKGIPKIGTPKYIASSIECKPPWVINSLTFGCPGIFNQSFGSHVNGVRTQNVLLRYPLYDLNVVWEIINLSIIFPQNPYLYIPKSFHQHFY